VSGGNDGTLRVWRLPRPPAAAAGIEADQPAATLRYLDGQRLLVGRQDGTLACWDRLRDRPIWSVRTPPGSLQALALDPSRQRVYCAGRDGLVRAWDTADGTPVAEWAGDGNERLALAVSADLVASAGKGGTVHLRRAATGEPLRDLPGPGDWVGALDFSPDGRTLAALTVNGGLRLWDTRSWQARLAVQGADGRSMRPLTLAFAPGGDLLAVGAWDKSVDLLDPRNGRRVNRLEGQDGWGLGAWAADGRRFVSASLDGRFRVWEAATGNLLLTLPLPEGQPQAMALGPDGRSVALACLGLTVWDAEYP